MTPTTQRVSTQPHSMQRSGEAERLAAHGGEPLLRSRMKGGLIVVSGQEELTLITDR